MDTQTPVLAAASHPGGVHLSGGAPVAVITVLALIGFGWLIYILVKKDKLKVLHVIAVTLAMFTFEVSPLGQLAFDALFGALSNVA